MKQILGLFGLAGVATANTPLQATQFAKYPGYEGVLEVTGTVSIGLVGSGAIYLHASLSGTDPLCTSGTDFTGNQCGVHIHHGVSCDTDDIVRGHHWNKDVVGNDDPWIPVRFVDGELTVQVLDVGFGREDLTKLTRTLVVHDSTDARVACSVITLVADASVTLTAGTFGVYPGYSGDLDQVSGDVEIATVEPDVQYVTFNLTNLDPICTTEYVAGPGKNVSNSCGIHIHKGMDCSKGDLVGGHLWNQDALPNGTTDPWLDIKYVVVATEEMEQIKDLSASMKMKPLLRTSQTSDAADGITYAIRTGFEVDALKGRAFVVHSSDGGRIACARVEGGVPITPPTPPPDSGALSFTLGYPILATLLIFYL